MHRQFLFLSGLAQYRIEARSREEAIRLAFEALSPDENGKSVIRCTMRDEVESQQYFSNDPEQTDSA